MSTSDSSPFLIVGLGNPGSEYQNTRHNLGFDVVDELSQRWRAPEPRKKFHSLVIACQFGGKKVLLLKPQTFMNRSGLSVREAVTFYKVDPSSHLLVISDDMDLPTGQLRLRLQGGSGGHNGLKSIIESLGSESFYRLRLGVGRPNQSGIDHLLTKVSKTEQNHFAQTVVVSAEAIEAILTVGMKKAMDRFNQKASLPQKGE